MVSLFNNSQIKTILVVNDHSAEAEHAANYALAVAQKTNANVLLANTFKVNAKVAKRAVLGSVPKNNGTYNTAQRLTDSLALLNTVKCSGFKPEIKEIDVADNTEVKLSAFVNQNEIWVIFNGVANNLQIPAAKKANADLILKKVHCPILFVPLIWSFADIQRLVYIADLRYCRLNVVKYLAQFAAFWGAEVSVANLPARGLPPMDENYARRVFNQEIVSKVNYQKLQLQNIKEKNLHTVVDVLINGLHHDLLVLLNHRFHFEEIIGEYMADTLPAHITVPVLVFP